MQNFIYHLLQKENCYKKKYIENTRETSVETPGVKLLSAVVKCD